MKLQKEASGCFPILEITKATKREDLGVFVSKRPQNPLLFFQNKATSSLVRKVLKFKKH